MTVSPIPGSIESTPRFRGGSASSLEDDDRASAGGGRPWSGSHGVPPVNMNGLTRGERQHKSQAPARVARPANLPRYVMRLLENADAARLSAHLRGPNRSQPNEAHQQKGSSENLRSTLVSQTLTHRSRAPPIRPGAPPRHLPSARATLSRGTRLRDVFLDRVSAVSGTSNGTLLATTGTASSSTSSPSHAERCSVENFLRRMQVQVETDEAGAEYWRRWAAKKKTRGWSSSSGAAGAAGSGDQSSDDDVQVAAMTARSRPGSSPSHRAPPPRWVPTRTHAIDLGSIPHGSRALARVTVTHVHDAWPVASVSADPIDLPHARCTHGISPLAQGMARQIVVECRGDEVGEWVGCIRVRAARKRGRGAVGTGAATGGSGAGGNGIAAGSGGGSVNNNNNNNNNEDANVLELRIPVYMRVVHPARTAGVVAPPARAGSARARGTMSRQSKGSLAWSDIPEDSSR